MVNLMDIINQSKVITIISKNWEIINCITVINCMVKQGFITVINTIKEEAIVAVI